MTQLCFEFTARRAVQIVTNCLGMNMTDKPSTKRLLTCLRCDQDERTKKELRKFRRICNECRSPKGKAKRKAWYCDDVIEYSIAIKSKSGAG